MIDAHGGNPQPLPGEVAASTASTVLAAGRDADGEAEIELAPLVELADIVGIETLAALWRGAEPSSLAGSLWALYLLRQWCRTASREVSTLWRGGQPLAAADAVVAGVGMHGDEDAVRAFADAVLIGAFRGDFDVALERAAAFFRVVAAGRRRAVTDGDSSTDQVEVAERNERVARALSTAAARWRTGTLR
jgi:hypothetical protein